MKKRSRENVTPEITPLIDVVFLLLIFFMVSTVFKKDEFALLLGLPQTKTGEGPSNENKRLKIELSPTELAYNGKKTSFEKLDTLLEKVDDKKIPIELKIDQKVTYSRIVKLLDKLKKYQLTSLELITNRESSH